MSPVSVRHVSLPRPPSIESPGAPSRASRTSGPLPPQMMSSPAVPFRVSDWLVPVIAPARAQRSAATPTTVVVLAVLFAEFGSVVEEDTVAVFPITVPLGVPELTFTTSVNDAELNGASVAIVQVWVPVPPTASGEQLHPAAGVTETKVVLTGITSLRVTDVASWGPSFRTVRVYVMLPPTATGSGESDFRTRRFAPELTVVVALAELFPVIASSVEATLAVLVMIVPFGVAAATFRTKVIVLVPTGTEGLVQVCVPVPPTGSGGQVHPAPGVTDTNVVPGGVVSERETFDAASGPELVTLIVYVMVEPATTGSGESTLETERSAVAATAGIAVANSTPTRVNAEQIQRSDAFTVAPPPRVSWSRTFLLHYRCRHRNLQLQ